MMNKFKIKYLMLAVVAVMLSATACKDYLDVNIDPNKSNTSAFNLQLSSAQLFTAIGMGERIFPDMNIWCQYHTGGPGVSIGDPDQHILASSEGNELFRTAYRSANNLNYILKGDSTQHLYIGIARILKAYNFQVCADMFGDVPYTEALNGDIPDGSVYHPKYDNAKDVVYPAIEAELLKAKADLANGRGTAPGGDDLIYGGDIAKWVKFANSLLLKMYLRQGASGQAKAAALYKTNDDFIIANSENAQIAFPGGSTGSNPFWNAAKSTALGNFYVATTTTIDYLKNTHDPRIDYFFDPATGTTHTGLKPGDIQNSPPTATYSRPAGALAATGGRIFGPTIPVVLMTAWEVNLLIAEASARGWITADATAAYETGVKASFEYLGVTGGLDTTYLQDKGGYNAAASLDARLKTIALQKWVCMDGIQPIESWIETRRFDSASNPIFSSTGGIFITPTKNALGGNTFPSILPYPENEESLNQSFPGQHAITTKVFWDN